MKIFLLTPLVLLFSAVCLSQTNDGNNTKTQPSRIKVYTPTGEGVNSASSASSYKWVVKTDLLKFITGEFPVIYEQKIAKNLSVEGVAGVTYSFFENDYSAIIDDESRLASRAGFGSVFRGTFKYYPSSDYDAIEGWSFGLQVFTKTNNRVYEGADNFDFNDQLSDQKDTKKRTGVALIISKQIFQDSNIAYESFIGVGYANVKSEYFTTDFNNTTGNEIVPVIEDRGVVNFQIGLRIGFGN